MHTQINGVERAVPYRESPYPDLTSLKKSEPTEGLHTSDEVALGEAPHEPCSLMGAISECVRYTKLYQSQKVGNAEIDLQDFTGGMIKNYIGPQMHVSGQFKVARLLIDNEVFMSTWPMEVQSHINPVRWAKGRVLVAGLGLGYYIRKILNNPEVTKIDVFETNEHVIRMYENQFGRHPKVDIQHWNVFQRAVVREQYDFAYIDIWPDLQLEKVITDMKVILELIKADRIMPWGIERILLEAVREAGSLESAFERFPWKFKWAHKDILKLVTELTGREFDGKR